MVLVIIVAVNIPSAGFSCGQDIFHPPLGVQRYQKVLVPPKSSFFVLSDFGQTEIFFLV